MSASKAWNLGGLKAALAIAGREAADLARMPEEVGHGPSHLGVIAHTAAFRTGGNWLDALLRGLDHNRTLLGALVDEHLPGVQYRWPQGTYLAWLDCRELGFDDAASDEMTEGLAVVSDLSGPARWFSTTRGLRSVLVTSSGLAVPGMCASTSRPPEPFSSRRYRG